MNAFQIQQTLEGVTYVSVPWIQNTYGLAYSRAKEFLAQLHLRGWVGKNPQGNRYPVLKENLRLRFLERSEVDDLILNISDDCGCALKLLKNGKCVTFKEMVEEVTDEEDTIKAIGILETNKLIYKVEDVYFSCVSDKTLEILETVGRSKRRGFGRSEVSLNLEKRLQLREMFDILFEDDE